MGKASETKVVIVGAGMGGLAAALRLASAGIPALVLEAADAPGGKVRQVWAGGKAFDAGPTVLTMKWVFDDLLAGLNTSLEAEVSLQKADLLARHYWNGGASLDLFADPERSVDAIAAFAGTKDAAGYRRFADDSRRVFETLKGTFIDAPRPNPFSLSKRIGFHKLGDMLALRPFETLWSALGDYFSDPRLRQLFGRYATYCGSSPFAAPATLMLVAHVEQAGVWISSEGMHAFASRLARLAEANGVMFRYGARAKEIVADRSGGKIVGVRLAGGEMIPAEQVIFNGDASALEELLANVNGRPHPKTRLKNRSQSALVACGLARPKGVSLAHHTVFFSDDYEAEFRSVFQEQAAPSDPTVYVCAQDRDASGAIRSTTTSETGERIYCLMNLPPDGDQRSYSKDELNRCLQEMDRRLAANGLTLIRDAKAQDLTGPDRFNQLFPATGGALYGQASHGWMASFSRPGSRSKLKGLYLAGGSVHPGPGIPMAALSGKIAADQLMADTALTGRSRPAAISGGTSTPRASVVNTPLRS